jgi:hypothetical protein
MRAVLRRGLSRTDESNVGFVHERRRLQRVVRPLASKACAGDPAEFVVHEREQSFEGALVPALPLMEKKSNVLVRSTVGHRVPTKRSSCAERRA